MIALGQGVSMALAECHAQFAKHRWDCTHLGKGHSFGYVLVVGRFLYIINHKDNDILGLQWFKCIGMNEFLS